MLVKIIHWLAWPAIRPALKRMGGGTEGRVIFWRGRKGGFFYAFWNQYRKLPLWFRKADFAIGAILILFAVVKTSQSIMWHFSDMLILSPIAPTVGLWGRLSLLLGLLLLLGDTLTLDKPKKDYDEDSPYQMAIGLTTYDHLDYHVLYYRKLGSWNLIQLDRLVCPPEATPQPGRYGELIVDTESLIYINDNRGGYFIAGEGHAELEKEDPIKYTEKVEADLAAMQRTVQTAALAEPESVKEKTRTGAFHFIPKEAIPNE